MSDKKPMILCLAGPNGSGKSTITQFFEIVGQYTNADDIVASTGISNEDAAKLADDLRYTAIANKADFTFETVLSSDYKLELLKKARSEGYFIKCIFILTADPSINVGRVETRVAAGGHNVDRGKIIKRYYKSLDNIRELMEICDILHVYDNTNTPVRIIRKHKEEISIFPNEIWPEDKILQLL
ncbi:MAG: zeta toxin family protein [Clostridiales bacterium]|nr:zeta toxin family protein [Clostridiales bacterium]